MHNIEKIRVNLGCGNKRKEGFIGVDKFPCDAVDKIADIEQSLPFDENSVDEIWMDNVIEHIRDIPKLMFDMHKICKNGAEIQIITPPLFKCRFLAGSNAHTSPVFIFDGSL